MKKWITCSIAAILTVLTINKTIAQTVVLLKTTYLPNYPSASGIAYTNGKLYIISDDATQLLVLTTDHIPTDSVTIFKQQGRRIPYTIKPDLESLTISKYKGKSYLAAVPSFSSEVRNRAYIFPLSNINQYCTRATTNPIKQLKHMGINEPNVEGSTVVKRKILISNRANLSHPLNYLITIPAKKKALKTKKGWKKTMLILPTVENTIGISDLEYWANEDQLFFTASTKATSSANADGAIGESFLGYINCFSEKVGKANISPDQLINLSKDLKIGNQKIEGLCVESRKGNTMIIHSVTDNDDGQSIIYKIQLTF